MKTYNIACITALFAGFVFGVMGFWMSYMSGEAGYAWGGFVLFCVGGGFCFTNLEK